MSSGTGAPVAGRSNRRRWWALVVVCLGMFMNALDSSIVNVALPDIQRELHFSQAGLAWVVDAFLITFGSFLLLAGRLGDLVGRKKIFLAGIAVFTASSVLCGVASSQAMLIIGRFAQGVGGAFSASAIIAIIVTEFPESEERARAMSAYIFVAVGGGSIGLLVGGVLTQALDWHWIFFVLEARLENPIMPLRILRIPTLVNSSVVRGFVFTGMFTTFFLGALYLEDVLGYSPVLTGLAFLPISLTMGVLSAGLTARMVTRFGNKSVLVPGMVSVTVGLFWLTGIGVDPDYLRVVLPAFLLIGFGAGTAMMSLLSIAMADVPVADAGLGSGIVNVSMQVTSAGGLAVLSTIATNHSRSLAAAGQSVSSALTGGYRLAFLISAVSAGVGTVVALVLLKGTPRDELDRASLREVEIESAGEPLAT